MANRKITVLNPSGYQEILQSGDNLLVDGSVDVQSNGLTGVPVPTQDTDAANKQYTDNGDAINAASIAANAASINANADNIAVNTGNISTNTNEISTLDTRLTTVENNASSGTGGSSNQISFQGTQGISFPTGNSFTLNQETNSTITVQGPDLSNLIEKPAADGSYIITKSGVDITYTDTIDGGIY